MISSHFVGFFFSPDSSKQVADSRLKGVNDFERCLATRDDGRLLWTPSKVSLVPGRMGADAGLSYRIFFCGNQQNGL